MSRFSYKALDESDREVAGELEAASEDEARARLEADGLRVESLDVVDEPVSVENPPAKPGVVMLGERDILNYGDSLTNLSASNLPIESGLRALSEEVPSRRIKRALVAIGDRLTRGESWEQIAAGGTVHLPRSLQSLFQAGLPAKDVGPAFEEYLHYTRRAAEARRRIWGAVAYSGVLILAAALIVLAYLIWVVPEFKVLYSNYYILSGIEYTGDFTQSLPRPTRLMLGMSSLLNRHTLVIVLGFAGVLSAGGLAWMSLGRRRRRRWICRIPLLGAAHRNSALSTFCHLLAVLLKRGATMQTALRSAGAGCGDAVIEDGCGELIVEMDKGMTLPEAAQSRRQFPERMLHIFEWSTRPEVFQDALHASGDAFNGQADIRARLIRSIFEPIVMSGVATVVVSIFYATYLPLFEVLDLFSWGDNSLF